MIKREVHIFLTAIMFYTRIPCPGWVDHNPDYINRATKYFPVIGWIVGIVYASCIIVLLNIFSPLTSILVGLALSIVLTGAFHEDGWADVCDGFGGGWTKDKILSIMKDSRVGAFGAIGVILILLLKISVTNDLISSVSSKTSLFFAIVTSHTISRMMAVIVIVYLPYARDDADENKAKPVANGLKAKDAIIAGMFAMAPLLILATHTALPLLCSLPIILLITMGLMRYFKKWIGGYTGDCLGTVQQVTEVSFLLSIAAIWKFI